jgi:penicillin amidase
MAPVRKNWSGVLPVPGDAAEYEWAGFRRAAELPRVYNPATHFIATANHNILPPGYSTPLGYEWALPFRFHRIEEMLAAKKKFTIEDFERMQQDDGCRPSFASGQPNRAAATPKPSSCCAGGMET